MYIDTHCHLQFEQYNEDLAMVLGNAKKADVKQFIVPGVDALSSRLAVELAQKHPGVIFASVGFHPYEASHNPDISVLKKLIDGSRVTRLPRLSVSSGGQEPGMTIVSVGEIGLDYHLFKGEAAEGKKQEQKMLFEEQLRLALIHNLPVIMHCRDAYDDFFTVLNGLPQMPRGVIHCFSGGLQELRQAQEYGLFVGIDGNVTYSKQLQSIAPHIPLEMLLLETDAPYLTPIPHRGTRNEPKYIPLVGQAIAKLQQKATKDIMEATTRNARSLFVL